MSESVRPQARLASLDALRGFDMFFITGGAGLIAALCALAGCGDGWLADQMGHVPWAGLHHHDTIFPLFLFLAGVSWPFSLAAQRARGRSSLRIHLKILLRTALLFLFGLSIGGLPGGDAYFRIPSVLGFIGISWGVAALLCLHLGTIRRLLAVAALVAAGYFALLHFASFPGAREILGPAKLQSQLEHNNLSAGQETYSKRCNVVRWCDVKVMPRHLLSSGEKACRKSEAPLYPGLYDPESLFALPGGVVIALLGMAAGLLLKSEKVAASRKPLWLLAAAGVSLLLALLFTFVLKVPMVKALWTVSFVFAVSAYSLAMLALFHYLCDVRGWQGWALFFRPIGQNSILVYMLGQLGILRSLYNWLFPGLAGLCGPAEGAVHYLLYFLVAWALTAYLGRKGVYLRV